MSIPYAELTFHPLADVFPLIDGDDFAALVADIGANGLQKPITLCKAMILDGRNRYLACRQAGVPILTQEYTGDDPLGFVLSANLHRRHLNESQRAMIADKLANMQRGARTDLRLPANLPEVSQADAARMLHVSERSVRHAKVVHEKAVAELARRVEGGELAVSMMAKVADLPVEEQQKLVRADEPTLRGAVKALLRRRREIELAHKAAESSVTLGSKLYGVIYADPPWRAETWSENGKDRAAENHYPTMATEDICALQVPAAANCVLFMWRPARMADIALRVMADWGFTFKSEYVWAKDRAITGYWNRNRHEVLMVGTRGTVPAPAPGDRWESIIEAHAGEHSTKPPVFAQMIEEMFPNVAKIELFARTPREGWDVWGNEVEITAAQSLVEGTEQIMDIGPGRVHHTTPIIIEDAANAEIGYQPSRPAAEHIVVR